MRFGLHPWLRSCLAALFAASLALAPLPAFAASYVKFQQFVEDLTDGVHDCSTDTWNFYLSNTTPSVSADAVKADLAEIATGNGYTGAVDSQQTCSETGGTLTAVCVDATITASGGAIADFRYVVLYNDTPTSPADPLIAYWDHGSTVSLAAGEAFNIDCGASLFTLQ